MCGENPRPKARRFTSGGSSPRVRGKRVGDFAGFRVDGLIPACAGKTVCPCFRASRGGAHPRVCGENAVGFDTVDNFQGSSPRVRGKHRVFVLHRRGVRLIPACAGKTNSGGFRTGGAEAHPRVCGENKATARRPGTRLGSSPRVRGKRYRKGRSDDRRRLIPACAGKTVP